MRYLGVNVAFPVDAAYVHVLCIIYILTTVLVNIKAADMNRSFYLSIFIALKSQSFTCIFHFYTTATIIRGGQY